ncbi:MAG: type IV secretory system conjugative DNA transfer family protein, partial [Acidobacteriota bacterium]
KHDTRDALGRLQAAWINSLMKRLLAADLEWGREHPCWLVIDEVHALKHLSALETVIVEGRKHGLKIIVGTQNKAQFQEHYGPGAATMLASFHTKMFFRCNEPESARWVSDLIGDEEKERPRLGTTASVQQHGRDSINYTTMTEVRPVVSKEEIMALPNLHGYWKHHQFVVPFCIRPLVFKNPVKSFVERSSPPIAPLLLHPAPTRLADEQDIAQPEIAETLDDIDASF